VKKDDLIEFVKHEKEIMERKLEEIGYWERWKRYIQNKETKEAFELGKLIGRFYLLNTLLKQLEAVEEAIA